MLELIVAFFVGYRDATVTQLYLPAFQRRLGRPVPFSVTVNIQVFMTF